MSGYRSPYPRPTKKGIANYLRLLKRYAGDPTKIPAKTFARYGLYDRIEGNFRWRKAHPKK